MSCAEIRGQLVAYRKHELSLLQTTKVEQHLARCPSCSRLHHQLSLGFEAAARPPEVDREHLVRMIARLGPYLESAQPEPRPLTWGLGGAMATLAAALLAFGLWSSSGPVVNAPDFQGASFERATPHLTQTRLAPPARKVEWLERAAARSLARSRPLPGLEMVASREWNGRIEGASGPEPRIVMDAGFAAFDHRGELGEIVRVQVAELEVALERAKVFVVKEPTGLTTIGLLSGRATVMVEGRAEVLAEGEQRSYGPGAATSGALRLPSALSTAAVFPAADEVALAVAESNAPQAPEVRPATPEPNAMAEAAPRSTEAAVEPDTEDAPAELSFTEQLALAEREARQGHHAQARARYEGLLGLAKAEQRPLVEYELARLLGDDPGTGSQARAVFSRLAQGEGEVAIQAGFALCQLELAARPCEAAACLNRMMTDLDRPVEVRAEAARLKNRWHLAGGSRCAQ